MNSHIWVKRFLYDIIFHALLCLLFFLYNLYLYNSPPHYHPILVKKRDKRKLPRPEGTMSSIRTLRPRLTSSATPKYWVTSLHSGLQTWPEHSQHLCLWSTYEIPDTPEPISRVALGGSWYHPASTSSSISWRMQTQRRVLGGIFSMNYDEAPRSWP